VRNFAVGDTCVTTSRTARATSTFFLLIFSDEATTISSSAGCTIPWCDQSSLASSPRFKRRIRLPQDVNAAKRAKQPAKNQTSVGWTFVVSQRLIGSGIIDAAR
jgi:hypothetical protein